jgi:hypothetical protein
LIFFYFYNICGAIFFTGPAFNTTCKIDLRSLKAPVSGGRSAKIWATSSGAGTEFHFTLEKAGQEVKKVAH